MKSLRETACVVGHYAEAIGFFTFDGLVHQCDPNEFGCTSYALTVTRYLCEKNKG